MMKGCRVDASSSGSSCNAAALRVGGGAILAASQANWIHPFADGNGRTARTVSYVVLGAQSGFILPGTPTIPDQIVNDRRGYFNALDHADAACKEGRLDLTAIEELLGGMLAKQLATFYEGAGGKMPNLDGALE